MRRIFDDKNTRFWRKEDAKILAFGRALEYSIIFDLSDANNESIIIGASPNIVTNRPPRSPRFSLFFLPLSPNIMRAV